jgi:hypothetical protein
MKRPGYLEEFANFWSGREEVRQIWMSMFTPQRGENPSECLTQEERSQAVQDLLRIRRSHPKLRMPQSVIAAFLKPPKSPKECIFAQTTETFSADFKTQITPCQFGGDPDCSRCGCYASMGLEAIGNHRLGGLLPVASIFQASLQVGRLVSELK